MHDEFSNTEVEDNKRCKNEGQNIIWWLGSYRCTSDDIIYSNYPKQSVIEGTLVNVQDYLEKLLKVIPNAQPFDIRLNDDEYVQYPSTQLSDYDINIAVTTRPFGNNDAMVTARAFKKNDKGFPYLAVVYINARLAPSRQPQSEDSEQRDFYYECIREILKVMGLSYSEIVNFHPHGSNQPHSNPTCELTIKGKKMTFLVTPYAKIYAKKHYGVTEFVGDSTRCPAGIEIEDMNENRDKRIFLAQRTFMTELMTRNAFFTTILGLVYVHICYLSCIGYSVKIMSKKHINRTEI